MGIFTHELTWWITIFDLPAMGGLLLLIWRTREDGANALGHMRELLETRSSQLREGLNAFKLEVAKNYASQSDMRALESRLTAHLLRIESKLDSTALKAEVAINKERNDP